MTWPKCFHFQYKKRLVEAQVKLEHQLRREEDEMFKVFQVERENEKRKLTDEIKKEWEVKLKELTEMYEKNMAKKKKKIPDEERKVCEPRHDKTNKMAVSPAKTRFSLDIQPV